MYLAMRISWLFQFIFLIKNLKIQWIYYFYIKIINRIMCTLKILIHLCFTKPKNKNKKWFCKSCFQCFSSEKVLIKHNEDCLSINEAKFVKLEERIIKFENYFKQLPVPFKIYADFECNFKIVKIYKGSYTKKYHDHVPCSFAYKTVCIDNKFSKPIVVYRGENAVYEFIKAILKEYKYCQKIMKKYFNKNLIMNEEEYLFRQSKSCSICEKLID